jgi:hypothetical protein
MKYGIWHRGFGKFMLYNDDLEDLTETCDLWNSLEGYELYEVQTVDDTSSNS